MTVPLCTQSPTRFDLYGPGVSIVYSTMTIDGSAVFTYRDGNRGADARDEEIHASSTALGTEITVAIEPVAVGFDCDWPDTGPQLPGMQSDVRITVLIPDIHLESDAAAEFDTVAIETTRVWTTPDDLTDGYTPGQVQTYRSIPLRGIAAVVAS